MNKTLTVLLLIAATSATFLLSAEPAEAILKDPILNRDLYTGAEPARQDTTLTLITETPEEGFQLAIRLSRLGVTETQPDRDVLFGLRDAYATDPDALIASSQVIAIHFQTIAAANNYWRE